MKHRMYLIASFAVLILFAGCTQSKTAQTVLPDEVAVVSRVVDGDTVELENGERVRLLGINSPESNEIYYKEAKEHLESMVGNKSVNLEPTAVDRDKYNRLLRYIFVDGSFVNLQMVKDGYASVYLLNPGEKYYQEFKDAEAEAKAGKLGMWSATTNVCMQIVDFNYDAEGNDNYNLNDEYVTFQNSCGESVSFSGWTIHDSGRNVYTFSNFVAGGNSKFTVYSGKGTDSDSEIYWSSMGAIWNNAGDTLFLRNEKGDLVLSYSYP
ncbi:MAG: thermonuclease family protein [Candidatus Aenigmarchaeota archaeon]|nr:thermonuclease family protein [Candidatus Aenigmarchaeota archaeon]